MATSDIDNWEPVDDTKLSGEDTPDSQQELALDPPFHVDNSKLKPSPSPIKAIQHSHGSSISSMDSSTFKSSPADPQLTELNSVTGVNVPVENPSALSSVTDIIDSTNKESHDDRESQASSFFNNVLSSLSFNRNTDPNTRVSNHSRTVSESSTSTHVPDIISYRKATPSRKSKRSVSIGSDIVASPLREAEKPLELTQDYDKKLYVADKLEGTNYRFSTDERNNDFHKVFKSVPQDDRLLDDFSCALSREFLFQGRIYISRGHICFNSNLLGWVTNLVISLKEVILIEKTSTAGLFPNGIAIETHLGKHQFASFISRDTTFDFIKAVWEKHKTEDPVTLSREDSTNFLANDEFTTVTADFFSKPYNDAVPHNLTAPPSRASVISENDSAIDNAIMSVDDFTPSFAVSAGGAEDDENSESLTSDEEEEEEEKSVHAVFKLKEDSGYEYEGPYYFQETSFKYVPEENNEVVLTELELNAPPGVVYQILFSDDNVSFLMDFLKSQQSSQFSAIPGFDEVNKDGQHYREYSYAKALNYPVGPKSTKCYVTETVLHCNYENYINVLNTTKTPDVPSGNSFSVKTRYMLRWASKTSCILKISFWVDWTGSSWIKTMVDKSCKSGQIDATETLVKLLREYVDRFVNETSVEVSKAPTKRPSQSRRVSRLSNRSSLLTLGKPEPSPSTKPSPGEQIVSSSPFFIKENIIIVLLITITLLLIVNVAFQLRIIRQMNVIDKSNDFLNLSNFRIDKVLEDIKDVFYEDKQLSEELVENMKISEQLEIWDWLDERANVQKIALDPHKRKQYQNYLHFLINKWIRGEVPSNESQSFLQKLDSLMKLVEENIEDKERGKDFFKMSKIKDAMQYLIDN